MKPTAFKRLKYIEIFTCEIQEYRMAHTIYSSKHVCSTHYLSRDVSVNFRLKATTYNVGMYERKLVKWMRTLAKKVKGN